MSLLGDVAWYFVRGHIMAWVVFALWCLAVLGIVAVMSWI
jgi:hypothetical protein